MHQRDLSVASGYSIAIGSLTCVVVFAAGLSLSALLLIGISLTVIVPMGLRAMQGRLDLFEPLVLANVALGVMFIGRPLADLLSGQFDHLGYDVRPTFDEALAVALVGVMFLQIGYLLPFGARLARYLPSPPRYFNATIVVTGAWAALTLGAALFWLFLMEQGGVELFLLLLGGRRPEDNELYLQSTGYLYNGVLMWAASALLFLTVGLVTRKRRYYAYFVAVSVVFLIFHGAQGSRVSLLVLVLAAPVLWFLWKGRRPRLRTVLVVMVVGLSLFGWLREIRTAGERGPVMAALTTALTSPWNEVAEILTGADADMFDALANELFVVPERLPFKYGATVTDIFVRAVPRPLWSDKPLEANDAVVETLWPVHYSKSRAGPAFSLIGPFYADSGTLTVMLGMFAVGAGFAMLWRWFQRYSHLVSAQLVYSTILPFVVILMRGSIPDTLSRALFVLGPLLLLLAFIRLRFSAPLRIHRTW